MKKLKNILGTAVCCGAICAAAHCADLTGTVSVNITSNTAATAKNIAMDEARRQIITDVLSQYADMAQLNAVVKNAPAADLVNLISESSIDGEKQSDTTYSAKITMTLDRAATRSWLVAQNVQTWLSEGGVGDVFVSTVSLSQNKVSDWAHLNQIARAEGLDLAVQSMRGNQIILNLPASKRGVFTIALREAGWHAFDQDGVLRVWR